MADRVSPAVSIQEIYDQRRMTLSGGFRIQRLLRVRMVASEVERYPLCSTNHLELNLRAFWFDQLDF